MSAPEVEPSLKNLAIEKTEKAELPKCQPEDFAPFIFDASASRRLRHPHYSETARTQKTENHNDLHSSSHSTSFGRENPA